MNLFSTCPLGGSVGSPLTHSFYPVKDPLEIKVVKTLDDKVRHYDGHTFLRSTGFSVPGTSVVKGLQVR